MKNLILVLLAAGLLTAHLSRRDPIRERHQCAENLRKIASDPEKHLHCPSAGYDTYSSTYKPQSGEGNCLVYCSGKHHGSVQLCYIAGWGVISK